MNEKTKIERNKTNVLKIVSIVGALFVVAISALLLFSKGKKDIIVGDSISKEQIGEFFYTYSTSANPPEYQRYHFYKDNNKLYFYHEKREGEEWPLTEKNITESGTVELTNKEWDTLFDYLLGGKVERRAKNETSDSGGVDLYLYWDNDRDINQQFSFLTSDTQKRFEDFCMSLSSK